MSKLNAMRHHITRRRLSPPLGFVHMPKAGGTAMLQQLDTVLRPRRTSYALDRSQFGGFVDFATMAPNMRRAIVQKSQYSAVPPDIIAGHIAPSTILTQAPNAKLITVLRVPQARLLSHWFYWRSYADDRLAAFGGWGPMIALARSDLAAFLGNPEIACQTDNLMLRMLLWPDARIPGTAFIDPKHDAALLAAARDRLRQFDHLDVIINPDRSARLSAYLQKTYGTSLWA
jgi:hypothetical protein